MSEIDIYNLRVRLKSRLSSPEFDLSNLDFLDDDQKRCIQVGRADILNNLTDLTGVDFSSLG